MPQFKNPNVIEKAALTIACPDCGTEFKKWCLESESGIPIRFLCSGRLKQAYNNLIEQWHLKDPQTEELHEFLGFTREEFVKYEQEHI